MILKVLVFAVIALITIVTIIFMDSWAASRKVEEGKNNIFGAIMLADAFIVQIFVLMVSYVQFFGR